MKHAEKDGANFSMNTHKGANNSHYPQKGGELDNMRNHAQNRYFFFILFSKSDKYKE